MGKTRDLFPRSSVGKESACNTRDPGSIPGTGRSPGEGNGNQLQYWSILQYCLENPTDRRAWQAIVHGVARVGHNLATKLPPRDLFKKFGDLKGLFDAKMHKLKDRYGKDLTEADKIKMWHEYTEELYKKDLNDTTNHDSVITHQELDPGGEVKWAFGNNTMNKAGVGDAILTDLFQILKKSC